MTGVSALPACFPSGRSLLLGVTALRCLLLWGNFHSPAVPPSPGAGDSSAPAPGRFTILVGVFEPYPYPQINSSLKPPPLRSWIPYYPVIL